MMVKSFLHQQVETYSGLQIFFLIWGVVPSVIVLRATLSVSSLTLIDREILIDKWLM